jgi:hypothetical protein
MRRSLVRFVVGSLFAFGCATPATVPTSGSGGNGQNSGSGGNGQSSGGNGQNSGSGGNGQNSGSGGQSSGSGGTQVTGAGGSSGSTGSGGSATSTCTADPTQLINSAGWNCDLSTSIGIQGAVYGYTDGSSCASPQPSNICTTGSCCISGTTVVDSTSKLWGCGIGIELDDSGGTSPVKSQYTGPVQCFNITLTGSSGGNEVRIGFTQQADNTGAVAPYVSVAAFTSGWTGKICLTDAVCPSWAKTTQCSKAVGSAGTPYDIQIQVSAGQTTSSVGTYNVCVSSIQPVTSGSTGSGGSGGGSATCTSPSGGPSSISAQFGTGVVGCGSKEYIVQNNEWGSTAGQTITYGPGTNFKVTVQKGTGSGNNPEGFPSVFTGANSGNNTGTSSGLPKAVSSIAKGGVTTSMTWADNGATGSYNAAYDVWFSTSSAGEPSSSSPSGGFLMVWYHMPSSNQPIGTMIASATLAGKNWNVWYGTNSGNGKPCVSYVAQTSINTLTYSLGDFIQDAVTRGYVQNSWYLTNVFAGFEIWNGGVGLAVTDFSVTVP